MKKSKEKQYLESLVKAITVFLKQLDKVMKEPSTDMRGKLIAQLTNALELEKDKARFFGLNIDYRTGKPRN